MLYDQLSFLTAEDQGKFLQLFEQSTNTTSISPDASRNILLKSNLNPHQLAKVWELSDINKTGDLLFPEFALALHLCNLVLRGIDLPYQLDLKVKDEVTQLVDKINFSVPEDSQQLPQQHPEPPKLNRSLTQDILESQTLQQQQNIYAQIQPAGYGFQQPQQPQQQQSYPPLPNRTNSFNAPAFNSQQDQFAQYSNQQQPLPSPSAAQNGNPFQNQQTFTAPQSDLFSQQQPQQSSFPPLQSQRTQSFPPVQTQFPPLQSQRTQSFPPPSQSSQATQQIPEQQTQSIFGQQPQANAPAQQPIGLTQQPTGLFSLSNNTPYTASPVTQQQPNNATSGPGAAAPLNNQQTGLIPINSQQTSGLSSLNAQATGGFGSVNREQTGVLPPQQTGGLVPLNTQQTGGLVPLNSQTSAPAPLNQQPTGLVPLKNQATGLTQQQTGLVPLNTQQTGSGTDAGLQRQATGLIPLPKQVSGYQPLAPGSTGGAGLLLKQSNVNSSYSHGDSLPPLQSQKTGFGNFEPLRQQKTGIGQNSFFLSNLIQKPESQPQFFDTVSMYSNQEISYQEKQLFNKIFENYDLKKTGMVNADVAAEIFRKSGLNREDLEKIWDLITRPTQTKLDKESFQLGMWLVYKRLNGNPIPDYLPDSLKPSSLKILDDVKNKLKSNQNVTAVKKSSNSKINASRFKNNDDELLVSRNRRRRTTTDFDSEINGTSKPQKENNLTTEKLSTEELKKAIWEKKILLEALQTDSESVVENLENQEAEDLIVIDSLKQQIKDLPVSSTSSGPATGELKAKFNQISVKVPNLIEEISSTISQIKNLNLELYKTKNRSVIIGTGPNGEITDADRKKFKSKQLLAVKMAKLTGKPLDPEIENFNVEEQKLNEEVAKIQRDSETNQKVIKDVQDSISELSKSITSALNNGDHFEGEDYKKFELGVGVQPEVQELIKTFRVHNISQKYSDLSFKKPIESTTPSVIKPSITSPVAASPYSSVSSTSISSAPSSRVTSSNYQTPEERKAYIREQARKKMSEKLAQLGIRKSSTPSPSPASPTPPAPTAVPTVIAPSALQQPQLPESHDDDSSSDDDDEEEFQRMEEIRRLKRLERDQRIADLGN